VPHNVQALINRQIRRSELLRRAQSSRSPVAAPCIALSRLPGSGGSELGQRVAERLGYEFFGIEIVDRIATAAHARRQLVEALDERVRMGIELYTADVFGREVFHESEYVRWLIHTIAGLGEHGGAVILGRGAAYILQPERTLRVLVVAPTAARVARVAREESLPAAEAARRVARGDQDRREFVRHHFKTNPDDPSLYDVAVNTETLGLVGATELVLRAFERRFPGLGAPLAQV
jgi:cytidylate kinase